jgi:ABC-2 type transport system ATP-binding protein
LLLDEPTIGLDVVAQVKIQQCLRDYNRSRGVTMLLTSHYMRDVEALCQRVLVINHGRLVYDGDLSGITAQFGQEKLIRLQFAGREVPADLANFGRVIRHEGPVADLRVERTAVADLLGRLLERYPVADVSVEDPPLEETIAKVFEQSNPSTTPSNAADACLTLANQADQQAGENLYPKSASEPDVGSSEKVLS